MRTFKDDTFLQACKYGLHQGHLGQLASLEDYARLAQYTQEFNIDPELLMLKEHPHSTLHITVPCLGFTDPIMDYSLYPWFAMPIAINGFVAAENQSLSRANIWATDIHSQSYQIFTDHFGRIDYEMIQSHLSKNVQLVSQIKEITFVYEDKQVLNGQGLACLMQSKPIIALMMARNLPEFDVMLSVRDKRGIVLGKRLINIQPREEQPKIALNAQYINQQGDRKVKIHFLSQAQTLGYITQRAHLEVQFKMQKDVTYICETKIIKGQDDNRFVITQYFGLGELAKAALIEALMPKSYFIKQLRSQVVQEKVSFLWKAYIEQPQFASRLYLELFMGLLNGSVPLLALAHYFVEEEILKNNLSKIALSGLDKHDKCVMENLLQRCQSTHAKMEFIDGLDSLLSVNTLNSETNIDIQLEGAPINSSFKIQANWAVESQSELIKYPVEATLRQTNQNRQIEYTITLPQVRRGEKIIENFNYVKNDKINLCELLKALKTSPKHSTVIHAKPTKEGDTQIWVEHYTGKNTQHLHVATLKGVSIRNGNLTQDLSQYIVGLR